MMGARGSWSVRYTGWRANACNETVGGFEQFKTQFEESGAELFGSGWVWLVATHGKKSGLPALQIATTSGHDNPIQQGKHPLLLKDVWEHAYYLKYENRRPEYLKNTWPIVNWKEVARRFERPDESTDIAPSDGWLH